MPTAIVIGAGFGGIAAALRLRHKGYDVTLIDKQDKLGGRAYQYERKTHLGMFIHDAGPTVITAKFLFDELFELFGKRREDYVEFRDLYPWYRIQFADGSTFDYGGTIEQMESQIRKFGGGRGVVGLPRNLPHSKKIFGVGFPQPGAGPFHRFGTMLKCAPDLLRLKNYKTVWGMAKKYIKNDNLRRVFSFQPLLVGGNPFNTTSIYSLIFYLEREWGVQFAMGGTGAIVRALEKLMVEEGIEIRLGEEVEGLVAGDGPTYTKWGHAKQYHERWSPRGEAVREVVLRGNERLALEQVKGDLVVCNADAPMVYSKLLDKKYRKGLAARRLNRKSQIANLKFSMGLFVMYFGTKTTYPDVAHHTIVLGKQYKELIDDLFDRVGLETDDLSVYLHRPTCTDPGMAPAGCESFYVLVPVPNNQPLRKRQRAATVRERSSGGDADSAPSRSRLVDAPALRSDGSIDWDVMGPIMREATVKYLERTILPNLSQTIVDDFYVTPGHFEKN
ncbi:MAG TPA: phytoene desaturase family protein, partial [Tepidisphaeraceae bacterium]|nr:phytoene desaturase family protein [Tepidisphaeraceae bacterium]